MSILQGAKSELVKLIKILPDSEVESAKKFLLYLIMQSENPFWAALATVPTDDEPLTEEEIEAEKEANKDIIEGRTFSLGEIKKEFGL